MKLLLLAVLTVTLVAAAFSSPSRGASASVWYWPPAFCKAMLQNHGVQIGDGRTFNVGKAYCVGFHNHCWLKNGQRNYKVFETVMRSYDGVVREMQMTVTGKNTWSGTKLKIIEHSMSASQFIANYGPATWSVAAQENQRGCFDIHP